MIELFNINHNIFVFNKLTTTKTRSSSFDLFVNFSEKREQYNRILFFKCIELESIDRSAYKIIFEPLKMQIIKK